MPQKTILVSGATGYLASRLIPRLLDAGYRVRCLARNRSRLQARAWFDQVEVVTGDVTRPETLPAAMEGVQAAYYLIHSMSAGHGYHELDQRSARNFSQAAHAAGVEHIIYVGGLANPEHKLALHLRSRIDTGEILREAGVPVTEFRAGVIAGAGSVSFEMIRFIAEQFPFIIGPTWLRRSSQPIATENVIDYLMAALTTPACRGRIVELGCETPRTYIEVMLEYARIRGLARRAMLIPFIPPWLMAFFVDKLTPVNFSYALPLVEGLQNDSMVLDRSPLGLFPDIQPIDYAEAVSRALAGLHPAHIDRPWMDCSPARRVFMHEGMFIKLSCDPLTPNAPLPTYPRVGGWELEEQHEGGLLRYRAQGQVPGQLWLERTTMPDGKTIQTLFWAPFGLPGFIYWHLALAFRA